MKNSLQKTSYLVTFLAALLFGLQVIEAEGTAQQGKTGATIPVTSTIDNDDSSNPGACLLPGQGGTQPNECLFRSDGAGEYTTPGVTSEIFQDTYWLLDLSGQTSRTIDISFSSNWKAVQSGPTNPPLADGPYPTSTSDSMRVVSRCYTSRSGTTIMNFSNVTMSDPYCSVRIEITHNGAQYLFVMAPIFPGTGFATVVCNQKTNGICVDSTITPTPSSMGPNPNVAFLYSVNPRNGKQILLGSALNSFVIHVTNP